MFGCLRRLGCLVILLIAGAAGYYWYTHRTPRAASTTVVGRWAPVTGADAERGRRAVASLKSGSGPVFANLTAAEAVAYLLQTATHQLPPSAEDVRAMITGDTLHVRAVLPLRALGAAKTLGPLAALLSERDTVQLSGTADIVRPGLAQFRVTDVRIHNLSIPAPVIPKLVAQLRRETPDGIAPNGLAIPLPPYIADIRIGNGKVTLYKNV